MTKVLIATEKPFAKAAIDAIRPVLDEAGLSWFYWKSILKRSSYWMPFRRQMH
jgi:hypothetical protein